MGLSLKAYRDYAVAAQSFSPVARKVVETFKLEPLEDTDHWIPLISENSPGRMRLVRSISTIQVELPRLIALLHQDTVPPSASLLSEADKVGEANVASVRISFIEDSGQFSTVQRVIDGLSACQELYEALQRIGGDSGTPLAIGAIDSGSDKSFDLFGAAELMKQFRELVVSIWGLVVFHKEHKLGKRLELIATTLPMLEQVNALEQAGRLGREEAQIVRNCLIDGARKFIATGVVTDDLAAHATHSPRALMAPEPKLLTGPASIAAKPPSNPSPNSGLREIPPDRYEREVPERLSEEDLERLAQKLAERSQRRPSPTSDSSESPPAEDGDS